MPDRHSTKPKIWFLVNLAVVLLSIVLAIDIIVAVKRQKERPGAAAEYLAYNFGTSGLWLVEVASNTFDVWKHQSHHAKTALAIEWIICLYSCWDAVDLLVKWKLNDEDLGDDLAEVVTTFVFYSYMAVVSFLDYQSTLSRAEYSPIEEETITV